MNIELLDVMFPSKNKDELDQWGMVHDSIISATDIDLSPDQCKRVFLMLPREDQGIAISYGLFDKEFYKTIFEWSRDNKNKILEISKIGGRI